MSQIDWLVCTSAPAPGTAGAAIEAAAEGCLNDEVGLSLRLLASLSPAERKTLDTLRFPKRRREWLLGRWTAKHLLRRARPEYATLPLEAISVGNDPDGAPYLSVAGKGRLSLCLSISHRNDRAFCALLAPPSGTNAPTQAFVGADIELVEPRDPAFVGDYFTANEAARVWHCPQEKRDALVTILWSAKEAVLKVLRLGLTVDTRSVELIHIAGIELLPDTSLSAPYSESWYKVQVQCTLPNTAPLCAWWRPHANYVLTLAAFDYADDPPIPRADPHRA